MSLNLNIVTRLHVSVVFEIMWSCEFYALYLPTFLWHSAIEYHMTITRVLLFKGYFYNYGGNRGRWVAP